MNCDIASKLKVVIKKKIEAFFFFQNGYRILSYPHDNFQKKKIDKFNETEINCLK